MFALIALAITAQPYYHHRRQAPNSGSNGNTDGTEANNGDVTNSDSSKSSSSSSQQSTSASQNKAGSEMSMVSPSNYACVTCQYLLEHIHAEMAIATRKGTETIMSKGARPETTFEEMHLTGSEGSMPSTEPLMMDIKNATDDADAISFLEWHGGAGTAFDPTDSLPYRPRQMRYAHTQTHENAQELQKVLANTVYSTLEANCNNQMPSPFFKHCGTMVEHTRKIVQLLPYDRNDEICMKIKMCDANSYIKNSPHAITLDLE